VARKLLDVDFVPTKDQVTYEFIRSLVAAAIHRDKTVEAVETGTN
jgi:hypothetical protein